MLLGDSGVGKTSLFNQYFNQNFTLPYKPTLGIDFLTKDITTPDGTFTLQIWDTDGSDRYQSLTAYYRGAEYCVIVFDVLRRSTFDSLGMWRDKFLHNVRTMNPDKVKFIVIGNKVDMDNQIESRRAVTKESALDYCKLYGMEYYETSAKEAVNVERAIHTVTKWIVFEKEEELVVPLEIGSVTLLEKDDEDEEIENSDCWC